MEGPKPNIFAMAPKWSTGYGYFTAGEAPIAISLTQAASPPMFYMTKQTDFNH
nr:hypothetical protein [Treponema denticola]